MLDRSHKDNQIQSLENIEKKYSELNFDQELGAVRTFRDTYIVKVVFMGGFNAGKSTLINKLIDQNVLIEAQKPQTTIATELYYTDGEEKIVAINTQTEEMVAYPISKQDSISSDKYDKAIIYLNNDVIKHLNDVVVVDMPGYDSGLISHNKAITKYIGESTIYLYIKPISLTGGLDDSDLGHINELLEYGGNVALIMNKTDLVIDDEKKLEITENVKNTLELNFLDLPTYYLSRADVDIKEKLSRIISNFDTQAVFDRNLSKVISSVAKSIKKQLEVLLSNVDTINNDEYEQKIFTLEKQKRFISEEFERKKENGRNSFLSDGVERICSQVNSGLENCRGRLISAIKNGATSEALSSIVTETVRPIINREISHEVGIQVNDIVSSVWSKIECEDTPDIAELLVGLAERTKSILESDTLNNFAASVEKLKEKPNDSNAGALAYKGVTGILAAATSIVAPPVEIIIILLPEIIKLGQIIFGKSTEEKISELLDNSYFPEVRNKLRISIENYMCDSYNNLVTALHEDFTNKTAEITAQIEAINKKRDNSQLEISNYIDKLRCDIESLDQIINND